MDHNTPIAQGGDNSDDNLTPLCKPCHSRKTASQDGGFGRLKGQASRAHAESATIARGDQGKPTGHGRPTESR